MQQARHGKTGVFIGCAVTAVMMILFAFRPALLETLEAKLYDYRFTLRGPVTPPDTIVIAAIDEKSLRDLGRWPWGRDVMARLLHSISGAGAEMIVFDVMFFEHDKDDPLLAAAIRDAGNVILPMTFDFHSAEGSSPESVQPWALQAIADPAAFVRHPPIGARSVLAPVAPLSDEAMGIGHINMIPDEDGTLRWEPLVIEHQGYLFPSIDLEAAALYLGIPRDRVIIEATKGIRLGTKGFIPTDEYGRSLIHYYGPLQSFRHVPASDIVEGRIPSGAFEGKIVLVGATAMGVYDLRVTPFYSALPGVEKHANVIASLLQNRHIQMVPRTFDWLVLAASGLLFTLVVVRFRAAGASAMTGLFLLTIGIAGYLAFAEGMRWLNVTYPALTVILVFVSTMVYRYAVEERYARKMRAMFSSYVTERVVNELIRNPEMAKLGGARCEVTVLFSDVKGFTSFAEAHEPERVVAILNEYLAEMTEVVLRWEGTLDKFIGDGILAFWGAPMEQKNHAELAVKCALHMVKRLEDLRSKWSAEGKPPLDCGIGINSGEVIVGNIGAEGKKMEYTVIGDHVNLASRIESLTRKYESRIIITEFTLEKIRGAVEGGQIAHVSMKGLHKVIVKGRRLPVEIYAVSSLGHGETSHVAAGEGEIVHMKDK